MDRFRTTITLVDNAHPQRQRTVRTEYALAAVEQRIAVEPNELTLHRAQRYEPLPISKFKLNVHKAHRRCSAWVHNETAGIGGSIFTKQFVLRSSSLLVDCER